MFSIGGRKKKPLVIFPCLVSHVEFIGCINVTVKLRNTQTEKKIQRQKKKILKAVPCQRATNLFEVGLKKKERKKCLFL